MLPHGPGFVEELITRAHLDSLGRFGSVWPSGAGIALPTVFLRLLE
jgi:hypothetical protein